MLRTIFTLGLLIYGLRHAVRGPFYGLLFYIWLAYFRPQDFVWPGSPFTSLPLSFYAAMWVVVASVATGRALGFDFRIGLLFVFLGHGFLSSYLSPVPLAMPLWLDFLNAMVMTYLLAILVTDVQKLRLVILVMVLSLGFEATKQGYAHVVLEGGSKNFNQIRILGDENLVSVGMFMLTPLAAALVATETRRWLRHTYIFVMIGIVFRGISTYSRGGFLSLVSVAGIYMLRARRRLLAIAAVALLGGGLFLMMDDSFWERMETIRPIEADRQMTDELTAEDASVEGRLYFWGLATQMAADRPWLGYGHASFRDMYDFYDTSNGAHGTRRAVHSMWFGLLAEVGYLGLALVLVQIAFALLACRRIRRRAKRGDAQAIELQPFAIAVETAIIAGVIGGSFVNFQYVEMFWHMIALTIAMNRILLASARRAEAPVPAPTRAATAPVPARLTARGMVR